MNRPRIEASLARPSLAIMLVVLFLLGSGCTTVRCYETDTVSDELQEENDEQSQQS